MNSTATPNYRRRVFTAGQKLPQPVRIMVGVVLATIIIVLTPILSLVGGNWSYIIREFWNEIVVRSAVGVKQLLWAATFGNQWFKAKKL